MKSLTEIKFNAKIRMLEQGPDGGACGIKLGGKSAIVIFSWGGGWDHVSVSLKERCPTWEEMCQIKDIFFDDDECVVQYHPAKKDYVNRHPHCLHLWRKQGQKFEMPPAGMV